MKQLFIVPEYDIAGRVLGVTLADGDTIIAKGVVRHSRNGLIDFLVPHLDDDERVWPVGWDSSEIEAVLKDVIHRHTYECYFVEHILEIRSVVSFRTNVAELYSVYNAATLLKLQDFEIEDPSDEAALLHTIAQVLL